jgi:hypothetical protein
VQRRMISAAPSTPFLPSPVLAANRPAMPPIPSRQGFPSLSYGGGPAAGRLGVQGFTSDRPTLNKLLDVVPALDRVFLLYRSPGGRLVVQGFTPDRMP